MTKLNTWPPKKDKLWPYCYTPDTTDGTARMLAALKERCTDDEIEVKRTGGGVLCRRLLVGPSLLEAVYEVKQIFDTVDAMFSLEAEHGGQGTDEPIHDGADSVSGGGVPASDSAGTGKVA